MKKYRCHPIGNDTGGGREESMKMSRTCDKCYGPLTIPCTTVTHYAGVLWFCDDNCLQKWLEAATVNHVGEDRVGIAQGKLGEYYEKRRQKDKGGL